MTTREALDATRRFMVVADAEPDYDGGIDFRDALKGLLAALNAPRPERVRVLRTYDRLESLRAYRNRKEFDGTVMLPGGMRVFYDAQRNYLDTIYGSR